MLRWIALFVSIPLVELVLLIEIGQRIGTVYTIALIVIDLDRRVPSTW